MQARIAEYTFLPPEYGEVMQVRHPAAMSSHAVSIYCRTVLDFFPV